jgi:hypothetical protein
MYVTGAIPGRRSPTALLCGDLTCKLLSTSAIRFLGMLANITANDVRVTVKRACLVGALQLVSDAACRGSGRMYTKSMQARMPRAIGKSMEVPKGLSRWSLRLLAAPGASGEACQCESLWLPASKTCVGYAWRWVCTMRLVPLDLDLEHRSVLYSVRWRALSARHGTAQRYKAHDSDPTHALANSC